MNGPFRMLRHAMKQRQFCRQRYNNLINVTLQVRLIKDIFVNFEVDNKEFHRQ